MYHLPATIVMLMLKKVNTTGKTINNGRHWFTPAGSFSASKNITQQITGFLFKEVL